MRTLALGFFAAILLTLPASAQQPTFGERVEVNAVLIDAVVTGPQGDQILGLGKDDFLVSENGVPQTIDSVDYLTTRRMLDRPEKNAPFNVERVSEPRYIVLFFDKDVGGAFFQPLNRARADLLRYLDRDIGANDLVAVAGHDVRLKIYSDFTSDKQQLKRALNEITKFGKGITTAPKTAFGSSILANIDLSEMMDHTGTTYEGLQVLAEALRPIRARKDIVLFSPGIHEPGEIVQSGVIVSTSRYYEPMIEALNASNVTVFALSLLDNMATEPYFHQTLERLTSETNGQYFRYPVSFTPALKTIEKETSGYYLITYRSNKPQGSHGFQKVNVEVKNHPDLHVKARAGYTY